MNTKYNSRPLFLDQYGRKHRRQVAIGTGIGVLVALLIVIPGIVLLSGWLLMLAFGILHSIFVSVPLLSFGKGCLLAIAIILIKMVVMPSRSSS